MAGASANGAAAAPMTLAELPLPELLALLAARGAAGTVHASAGEAARRLYLIDGRLAGVASSDQRDRLGQLLLALGLITQERLAEALAVQEQLAAPLGQILLRAAVPRSRILVSHLQVSRPLVRLARIEAKLTGLAHDSRDAEET